MASLALTLDDGPDPVMTPRLLDLFAARGARASFFPIADRAAAHPNLIARMLADGHTVGIHCCDHVRHSERDLAWVAGDADRALATLTALGARPVLWRTPWGDLAPFTNALAAERDLRIVGWDVDTHDWRGDPAPAMFAATRAELRPGAIILAHDGIGPGARRVHAGETVRYAECLLDHAGDAGLDLEAL